MKTLKQTFEDLMKLQTESCGPFPQIQIQEMNRAYMAGAASVFFTVLHEITNLSNEAAEKELQKMREEIETYFILLGQVPRKGTEGN